MRSVPCPHSASPLAADKRARDEATAGFAIPMATEACPIESATETTLTGMTMRRIVRVAVSDGSLVRVSLAVPLLGSVSVGAVNDGETVGNEVLDNVLDEEFDNVGRNVSLADAVDSAVNESSDFDGDGFDPLADAVGSAVNDPSDFDGDGFDDEGDNDVEESGEEDKVCDESSVKVGADLERVKSDFVIEADS